MGESMARSLAQVAEDTGNWWRGEETDIEKDILALAEAAGYTLAFPTPQLIEWYKTFRRWLEDQPDFSYAEFIRSKRGKRGKRGKKR
jgi:hypothetical protein